MNRPSEILRKNQLAARRSLHIIQHTAAPVPATIASSIGCGLFAAEAIRDLIKNTSRDAILSSGRYPETSAQAQQSQLSDLDVLLGVIRETIGAKEIKLFQCVSNSGTSILHHIAFENPDLCSIGFNADSRHFYLRSENQVLDNIRRHAYLVARSLSSDDCQP